MTHHPTDKDFAEPYFKVARVQMSDPIAATDGNGVIHPYCDCAVITENDQIWTLKLSAFVASHLGVKQLWETQPSLFKRAHSDLYGGGGPVPA